jgi:hypothetical protein
MSSLNHNGPGNGELSDSSPEIMRVAKEDILVEDNKVGGRASSSC